MRYFREMVKHIVFFHSNQVLEHQIIQNLAVIIISVPQAREKPAWGEYAQESLCLCLCAHQGPQSIRTRKDRSLVVDFSEEGEEGKEMSVVVYLAARSAPKRNTPPPGVSPPVSVPEDTGLWTAPHVVVSAAAKAGAVSGAGARRVTHPFVFGVDICGFSLPWLKKTALYYILVELRGPGICCGFIQWHNIMFYSPAKGTAVSQPKREKNIASTSDCFTKASSSKVLDSHFTRR